MGYVDAVKWNAQNNSKILILQRSHHIFKQRECAVQCSDLLQGSEFIPLQLHLSPWAPWESDPTES